MKARSKLGLVQGNVYSYDLEGSACSPYIFCLLDSCFLNKHRVFIPAEAQKPLEGKAVRCYLRSLLKPCLCFGNVQGEGVGSANVLRSCRAR